MSQKNVKWTAQQSRAISEHERSVFVSASAGTGKTAVLSGSCVDAVSNASVCPDIWSILVLTFTDMAAEQMRSRIAQQLNSVIEASKDADLRQHLRRQLILLGAADISTIHSFCKRLITEHFYELGLDPTFRVLDADEAELLKAEVLERTIEFAWRQPNLADALRRLLARRDLRSIEGFPSVIIEISDFLDSVVSRDDWLARTKILSEAVDPFTTDLADAQKRIVEEKLKDALGKIEFALKIYKAHNPSGKWNEKCRVEYIDPVRKCLEQFKAGRWEFARPRVSKPDGFPQADVLTEMVGDALNTVRELKDLAILNPEYLNKFAGAVGLQTMVLVEMVKYFDKFYAQAKNAVNCLDFADLEHYALRLLTAAQSNSEKLGPSQTALKLREKYKYIFVDEYQDINSVQQVILDMLRGQDNVFAVGDPKQSIYQWRGANPDIFIENLRRSSARPAEGLGLRVDLNVNFRSVRPILDFVNLVFSRIMTARFANIDYDESAHLQPALENGETGKTGPAVELHILDKPATEVTDISATEDTESTEKKKNQNSVSSVLSVANQKNNSVAKTFSSRQLQAALIARRIKEMVGVDKKTGGDPVEYRDIVILMRSLAGRNDFIEALRLCGIPVSCEATAGYFQATEITDMLSLLKVLDNPRRDIELAAILRSPFFNLTDSQLAKIRLFGKKDAKKTDFYDCVTGFRKSDDSELFDKLAGVLATLDDWRAVARRGRLAELIWHIYRQTGYLSFVLALPDGPARRANLLKLHDRAIQFENFAGGSGVPSLTRFVDFIEKLLESGQDWAPAEPESASGNAVRVLSVHKCKGLEFPVVFVADLDSSFSKKADRRDCLLDEQMTLGLQLIDPETNSRIDSIAWQVIDERNRRKALSEEIRILYVAMTRAMDRLILVGCKDKNRCHKIYNLASYCGDGPIPRVILDSCNSHLDWILSALSRQYRLHQAFQTTPQIPLGDDDLFNVRFYEQPELGKLSVLIQSSKCGTIINHQSLEIAKQFQGQSPGNPSDFAGSSIVNSQTLVHIRDSLNWLYPFGDAPQLPAKRSVTQFTHRNDEFTKLDCSLSLNRKPKIILETEQIDGRSVGSAAHLVLSQLNLALPITAEAINSLVNKLLADGAIPETVAPLVNVEAIMKFFETDLGRAALDTNNKVFREWPFTFAIPASQWNDLERTTQNSKLKTQDSIIVQGIIDLLIKTPEGLVVVDFKTDDVSADGLARRAELYRAQLDLYAQAANAILSQKVFAKWLYFLIPGHEVKI